MSEKRRLLHTPVEPFTIEPHASADQVLDRMRGISFQGRNLATAHDVWRKMLGDDCVIFLGVAGALSAGGLRLVIAQLITQRFVDCVVSTGANLYHDLHECRGRRHFQGSPAADDRALQAAHIDRVYDTFMDEEEFIENDNWIAAFASTLDPRPYTSRELLYRLGGHLWSETGRDGILTAAYRANVPIFCPAIADSSIGMGLSQARQEASGAGHVDVIGDIIESANIVIRKRRTASVVLGGGTPKNFINQASVQAEFYSAGIGGHQYALQIVTDVPHFGGASGSTLDEAQSWGKVAAGADQVTVNVDATVALPFLTTALASTSADICADRRRAAFDLSGREIILDGEAFPDGRFET
ncbi:MAG: deoxyhypusine synthase family protein [Vicinamibacterales bacterium]|jgi:deoxyhypusine synthase|nr:deoxyhypusine synthase [Acidobacteriota bacterium]MDP7472922.1 deoxyhypusine synthase family protein [Vicinamibacterales bacterium]MDP7672271.1 deoxyhypusine synthase family protein [Vicinamibacterales bacterium]HJO37691.1 deoxyhypusine synthase family protein [Vicinamibacterales bacterium]